MRAGYKASMRSVGQITCSNYDRYSNYRRLLYDIEIGCISLVNQPVTMSRSCLTPYSSSDSL